MDDGFPGVVGYGTTPEEAERALEEKLPQPAPPPRALRELPPLLPLSPAHGLRARPAHSLERSLEKKERSDDALDRAILVGSVDSNRRRH